MNIRKVLSIITVFSVFALSFVFLNTNVFAAGVATTVSTPANGEFDALTDTDVTFGYTTSSTEFANTNTISIGVSPTLNSALTDCAAPTTDADGDVTGDGALGGFTTSAATYTFTAATTTASTGGVDICLNFQNDTAAGIYSISFNDDNDTDFGSVLIYVGDDNDVTVTAQVQPLLSFAIRNTADTSDTNICDLGVLDNTSVSTCSYRLKPSTNSASGYTVQIDSDGDLRRSGSGDVADSEDLDPIAEDTTVTAGTEGYGIQFAGGAATVGSITESGDFNDDDTPIPLTATNLFTSDGVNSPSATDTTNTALVTHRATVDFNTLTGNFSQIVTYYVSASF